MYAGGSYCDPRIRELKKRRKRKKQYESLLSAIVDSKCPDIPHYTQQTLSSCGPTCLTMVLNSFGIEKNEWDISPKIGRKPNQGTSNESLVSAKDIYNLDCEYGNNGSIADRK